MDNSTTIYPVANYSIARFQNYSNSNNLPPPSSPPRISRGPTGEKLRACEPCRKARIRCTREVGSIVCNSCIRKRKVCNPVLGSSSIIPPQDLDPIPTFNSRSSIPPLPSPSATMNEFSDNLRSATENLFQLQRMAIDLQLHDSGLYIAARALQSVTISLLPPPAPSTLSYFPTYPPDYQSNYAPVLPSRPQSSHSYAPSSIDAMTHSGQEFRSNARTESAPLDVDPSVDYAQYEYEEPQNQQMYGYRYRI